MDLTQVVVVTPPKITGPAKKAITVLIEEVEKRSRIRWTEAHEWPAGAQAVVAVGLAADLKAWAGPHADAMNGDATANQPEGFCLRAFSAPAPAIVVAGNDARGVLYGVGRLLRELHMTRNSVTAAPSLNITTAPKQALRGHQLGYRPKTNSYDAWTAAMWDQYIRDLAIFGANAIELMPPRTDDDADSPHFPLPQIEMMKRMSQICDDYGMDVWIWYPAMDKDYSDPATVDLALKEWGAVFEQLPRIDAIFVPGGDPGHTQPKYMMALLEKETEVLHRSHPKAQMWMSPQSFDKTWTGEFLDIVTKQQPKWLSGIVFGPQNRLTLAELRKALPAQYPIRHYPDITHSMRCQFPVPDWDLAFAATEQRECINPRPVDFTRIFRLFCKDTIGFLTYSEGCNDDVNKAIWSGLGWDPDANVVDILRQYARYYIGDRYTDDFAQGLLALERNWRGPLLANKSVMTTLTQFQAMERAATPQDKLNWRFQQALYRAYYDAYDYRRLAYESQLEQEALDTLRDANRIGSTLAMQQAEQTLDRAVLDRVAKDLRARVFELAEALYQSVRMQLSVPRYQAIDVGRGANLDLIDVPLNSRLWLESRFAEIRQLPSEGDRIQQLHEIANRTNPGPGGFYDDLGDPAQQTHLVRDPGGAADPEFREASLIGTQYDPRNPRAWSQGAETRYDAPLRMKYEGLDPTAAYTMRVVYGYEGKQIRCVANDTMEVHPYIKKERPPKPLEFDLPREATAGGSLNLSWFGDLGVGGSGRGCNVAEIWLIKKTP